MGQALAQARGRDAHLDQILESFREAIETIVVCLVRLERFVDAMPHVELEVSETVAQRLETQRVPATVAAVARGSSRSRSRSPRRRRN